MFRIFIYFMIMTSWVNFNPKKAYTSSFFSPDGDTALLFQIVTNTATQINELEQLITNAQKHTKVIEKYNQIAKDHYYRAERIHYLAQSFVELSQRDPQDLSGLNSAIRALKSETESLKSLIAEYRVEEFKNDYHQKNMESRYHKNKKEVAFANQQLKRTGYIQSTNEASKLTAQNTALNYKAMVENNQLAQAIVMKLSEQNKLTLRQMKEGKDQDLKKQNYYNFNQREIK